MPKWVTSTERYYHILLPLPYCLQSKRNEEHNFYVIINYYCVNSKSILQEILDDDTFKEIEELPERLAQFKSKCMYKYLKKFNCLV